MNCTTLRGELIAPHTEQNITRKRFLLSQPLPQKRPINGKRKMIEQRKMDDEQTERLLRALEQIAKELSIANGKLGDLRERVAVQISVKEFAAWKTFKHIYELSRNHHPDDRRSTAERQRAKRIPATTKDNYTLRCNFLTISTTILSAQEFSMQKNKQCMAYSASNSALLT